MLKISKFRLFRKRTLWLPTWRMVVVASLIGLLVTWWLLVSIHGFLAKEAPVEGARIVIVEGWLSDEGFERVRSNFEDSYDVVYTTGVAIGRGGFLAEYKSYAQVAEKSLEKLGLSEEKVISVPSSGPENHRTYSCAVGLRELLESEGLIGEGKPPLKMNLISEGVHSRRSQMAFQKALGEMAEIGVFSIPPMGYDPKRWWKTGGSAKTVLTEIMAWGFEWLFDSGRD